MEYILLAIGLGGAAFSVYWLRRPEGKKDLILGILALLGSLAMTALCLARIFL